MCLRQLWTSFGGFWRPLKENWCTGLKNCGARSFYHLGNQSALEKQNICKLCRNWMLKLGPSSYQVTWAAHHELSGILTTKLQYKMCKATLQHQMEVVYVWSGQSRSRRHNQLHEEVAQKPTVLTSATLPFLSHPVPVTVGVFPTMVENWQEKTQASWFMNGSAQYAGTT